MKHPINLGLIALGAVLLCAKPASAVANQAELRSASLAATCANCHNTNGKGVEGAAVGGINRLTAAEIETAMQQYKSGERSATVMHQISKGYTDEQIRDIARYLGKK